MEGKEGGSARNSGGRGVREVREGEGGGERGKG